MWGKHKKLNDWVAAGLLTDAQADAIQSYEDGRRKGHFGRGLIGLSLFAILTGVVSIIASNWDDIPATVKISLHALLNLGVGFAAFKSWRSGNTVWREGMTLCFFGLTLTFIVLVGQIFQLDGTPGGALLLWMLITLPFMLIFSASLMTAVPWMAAFLTTVFYVADENLGDLPALWESCFYIGLSALLPLALLGLGSSGTMKRLKPVWAPIFQKTGIVILACVGTASTFFWIGNDSHRLYGGGYTELQTRLILVAPIAVGLLALAFHNALHRFFAGNPARRVTALFAAVSLALYALPVLSLGYENSLMQALLFIGYWIFIGWLAQGLGYMRIISLAIVVIAIRIFAIYVELFGSLMDTGIGLIVGGVVMLGLLALARRLNNRLTRRGLIA